LLSAISDNVFWIFSHLKGERRTMKSHLKGTFFVLAGRSPGNVPADQIASEIPALFRLYPRRAADIAAEEFRPFQSPFSCDNVHETPASLETSAIGPHRFGQDHAHRADLFSQGGSTG